MEITIKRLKPYHIKADANHLYVIVSPENFTLTINGECYQFVPYKAKEIIINRKTKKIANPEAEFSFQKYRQVIYLSMAELISHVDFSYFLNPIIKPFYVEEEAHHDRNEMKNIIGEFDRLNIKRLIDKSLDERDEAAFNTLLKLL